MPRGLVRDDSRTIIHFDYDCFYASVVEQENPALKSLPLAIQQKQIVVTCNYEARKRGLRKLQLITEAKKVCPEAVIVLGEDLTRFRHASKELYNWLRAATWSDRAERLGFDEAWLDCTDMIAYNISLLNHNNLRNSFFCLDKEDPTLGFPYDASAVFGPTQPKAPTARSDAQPDPLLQRLILGSHLAAHLRHELEKEKGYTATVGISTNKVLSKLVGNVNKPCSQTTLTPPYDDTPNCDSTVTSFLDDHEIGKIPGIGFKLAQKIRARVLGREAAFEEGLIYGGNKDPVTVHDVRTFSGMGPELLEDILSGPGSQRGIGGKIWDLLHGVDETEVAKAKRVPSQISQEDSYKKYLHTFEDVRKQLQMLAERLIRRMHLDLMEDDDESVMTDGLQRRWLAHPRTLRLSTRPRPPLNTDWVRSRTFHRISRSSPFPNFAFSLSDSVPVVAERLVEECLVPMFRKLHPERSGWNLSLVNVAVTNMVETATDSKESDGRDIGRMFRNQDDVLKDFRVVQETDGGIPEGEAKADQLGQQHISEMSHETKSQTDSWDSDPEESDTARTALDPAQGSKLDVHGYRCDICEVLMPQFAATAHRRYHNLS